jgi:NAD(P)-dependent dehydrogenase (short-subunit alcohol dehydrogenase family)
MSRQARPSIFITGAGAGIGRAVAERFAAQGWFVGLFDVDEAAVQQLAANLGPAQAVAGRLDVREPQDWAVQLAAFAQVAGRLDVLFNNAGVSVTAPFEQTDLSALHRLVDINLKGVMNGCHLALPQLRQTPGARVINMSSASAFHGQPMLGTYSATKAAVRTLTEALDIEWAQWGIRVVCVMPLFVNTAMVRDDVSKMKTVQMLGVHLSADDIAGKVWQLATRPPGRLPTCSTVGWQTAVLALASKLSPAFMNRWVTAWLAGY